MDSIPSVLRTPRRTPGLSSGIENVMERMNWAPFLLGVAAGAVVGLLLAPEAPQRWKRKARSAAGRGRELMDVLRDAAEVVQDFRSLARPLDDEPYPRASGKLTG